MTNGISHPYQLDESTFILRGIRGNFSFFISFLDENHVSKQNSPRWDAAFLRRHILGYSVCLCPILIWMETLCGPNQFHNESRNEKTCFLLMKTKAIPLSFLDPKVQSSSHLLFPYSPVCVRPVRKSRRQVFS